jgi:ketol-acid reductoisomerase
LRKECKSDLFGERNILLAGVYGAVEALFRHYVTEEDMDEEKAFRMSVENITGPLRSVISKEGISGVYKLFSTDQERAIFERAYSSAYNHFRPLSEEIYDEVNSGNEIRSVVMTGKRLKDFGWTEIGNTRMWEVGAKVRATRRTSQEKDGLSVDPTTAGIYCAMMMAQVDTLLLRGHCISEIVNESIIEASDSLLPYMHFKGVGYMVDNCSETARKGTRKWGPVFEYATRQALVTFRSDNPINKELINAFKNHIIHEAFVVCAEMRPPTNLFVD